MEKKRKNTFDLHQRWEKMLMHSTNNLFDSCYYNY